MDPHKFGFDVSQRLFLAIFWLFLAILTLPGKNCVAKMVFLMKFRGVWVSDVALRKVSSRRLIHFLHVCNTDTSLVVGGPAKQASYWIRLREGGGRAMSMQRFSAGMIDSRNGKCMLSPN